MSYQHDDIEIDPQNQGLDSNTRLLATLMHLSGFASLLIASPILLSPLGPLIFWLVTRENHPFLDDQGKEALNFQISVAIYTVLGIILAIVTFGIGALLLFPLFLFWIICPIIAAIKANSGEWYRYPLTIRLVS